MTAAKEKASQQSRAEGRLESSSLTWRLAVGNCGSQVLNLNQQILQLSVTVLVRTKLREMSLPLA